MAYEDVPQRLAAGEAVPRSEIIGHYGPDKDIQVTLGLESLSNAFILERVILEGVLHYQITALGLAIRWDLIVKLEGDCPECPECP